ncbi:MAG: DUF2316 family protein [Solirubrobacteraceae bacterium]|nr:DUF2316 family protein [Solirubrobacteraceae bacterium]
MSLTFAHRQATSSELRANLALSGLTPATVERELGLSHEQFETLIDMTMQAKPHEVWLLRDFLELAVREAGREPAPYSVLTPEMREAARRWFSRSRRPGG